MAIRKKSAFEEALDFVGKGVQNFASGAGQAVSNVAKTAGNFYNNFSNDYNNRIKLQQAQNEQNRIKASNFAKNIIGTVGNEFKRDAQNFKVNTAPTINAIKPVFTREYWDTTTPEYDWKTGKTTPKFWSEKTPLAKGLVNLQTRFETGKLIDPIRVTSGDSLPENLVNMAVNLPGGLVNSVYGQGILAPTSDIMHVATDPFRYGKEVKYSELNSGPGKIGYQIAGLLNPDRAKELGIKLTPQEAIGNVGQMVGPIVDAWTGGTLFSIGKQGFVTSGKQVLPTILKGGANTLIPGGASVASMQLSANRDKGSVGEQLSQTAIDTALALPLIFVGGAVFSGLGVAGSKFVQQFGPKSSNFMLNKAPIADYLDGKATPEVKAQLDQMNGGDISTGQGPMWNFLREAFPEHFDADGVPLGSLSGEIKKLNIDSPDDKIGIDAREVKGAKTQGVAQDEVAFRRRVNPTMIDGEPYVARNKIGHVIEPNDYFRLEDALYYLKSATEKGNIEAYLDPRFINSENILKEVGGDYLGRNFTKTQPIESVMTAIEERLNFDKPDVIALQKKLQAQQIEEGLSNNLLARVNEDPAAKMIKEDMDQALSDTGNQIVDKGEQFRTGPTAETDFNMSTKDAEAAVKSMIGDAELAYINGGKQIVTPDGQLAHGKYYDSIISVVEQNGKVQDKTVYHEAFHAYVDKFVDKSLYKTALDDVIANQKLTDKEAAEQLAEGFADYMSGRREGFTGAIVQFFADLVTSIRTLIGKESAANMMYSNIRRGNRTPNQGSVPVNVANTAYADTIRNGGVTINLAGGQPAAGFAYSPYKGIETIVPKAEFNPQNIRDFVAKNQELLSQPGNHIGMWEDNGQIYMDISQVGPANAETLAKAQEANQLAAFDLGTFEEIPLGTIDNGVYNKTYEAVNHPYLNRGQDTATNPAGDGAGVPEVPSSESTSGTDTASRATPEEFFRKVKNGETPPIDQVPTPEEVIASIKEIQGEKPAPEPAQPKAGQKKRGFIETVEADASVPDAIKKAIEADPRIFYDTYTNQSIMDKATQEIASDAHKVTAEVLDGTFPTSGIQQAELVAKTVGLAQEAIKAGKNDLAEEIIINGAMRATPLAQGLQAFSLWNRVTPEGMLAYGLKEVKKANDGSSILRSLGITSKAEIKPETRDAIIKIMQEAQKMADGPEKAAKIKEAVKLIGESIPLTASEIFDAFRYQNLLSNPLTHLRNFYGNNLQGMLIKPATTLVEGGLDLVQSALTGRERKTYMSEVPTYYKGMINSVPLALERLKNSITRDITINQPDLRSIRQERMPKALTVVPRFLEAADQFFSTIIEEGEYAAQRAKGISDATARKSAHDIGQKYLFRNELDVKNKTGQGTILTSFDKATAAMYKARNMELFGIKPLSWFVPFLKTPMNIAKMQIEYSPLGYSTMIGNTNKTQQFAKASIGTAVSGVGALFAFGGRTTWATPTDQKEKELFYASGRRPYSVLVNTPMGERWVPMQFLGPLATAFAIPAAMKYYNDESKTALTDSQLQKAEKIAMGLVRQYSANTFLTGLGNFLQVAEGNTDVNLETVGGQLLGQAIPLNGLISYVSRVVDPVYRKPSDFGEQLKSTIPFLSKSVPAYEDINGNPAERQQDLPFGLRSANTLPYGLGQPQDGGVEALYKNRQGQLQLNNLNNYNLKQIEKGGKVKVVDGKIAGVKGSNAGDGDFLMTQLAPDKNDYTGLAPETVRKMKRSHDFTYATTLQQLAKDGTITPELLEKELKRKGITKEDIVYDEKTKLADDVQLDQIKDEIDGLTGNEYLAKLVEMRRVSEGSRKALLSDTLIGKLEKEGYISESEADYLKSIGWDDKTKTFKKLPGTGKGKKIDFKIDVKYPDINPPKGIVSSLGKGLSEAYAPIKLKRSEALKMQLPLNNPKYEPGQLPSGRISAQIRPMAKTLSQLGQI